jgi:hypothetical protein
MPCMAQFANRITTEVAPSKLPSIITRGKHPVILDTIKEDDKEGMVESSPMTSSSSSPPHKVCRGMEVMADTPPPLYCAHKPAFLGGPMAKTGCFNIKV